MPLDQAPLAERLDGRIGAFPENPDWVAPIQVLYAKDAPDEGYFGDCLLYTSPSPRDS